MPSELVADSFLFGLGLLGLAVAGGPLGWWQPARARAGVRSPAIDWMADRWGSADRRLPRLVALALAASVIVAVLGSFSPVLGIAAPLVLGGAVWRKRRISRRRQDGWVAAELPEVADLLAVAASAGLTPHAMLDLLAELLPDNGAVVELAQARTRAARGGLLADELDALGLALPRLGSLTSALAGAERFGVALEPALVTVARDARVARRRRIEEQARRLPIRLLFPLVVCVLPAFVLLTVVPVLMATVGDLVG